MRRALWAIIGLSAAALCPRSVEAQDASHLTYQRWRFFANVDLHAPMPTRADDTSSSTDDASKGAAPSEATRPDEAAAVESAWFDFILSRDVFSNSRPDLGDLRLVDAADRDVPYVLRIRAPDDRDERVSAAQFNEAVGMNGVREYSYDLGENPPEHNQLEVEMGGDEFRRYTLLEGSDDAKTWSKLVDRYLLRFHSDTANQHDLDVRRLHYSPSRHRYLRLRIERDPLVDHGPVAVASVHVHRRIEVPGEFQSQPADIGYREATRALNSPASAWILSVPGRLQPFTRLRATIGDVEFARDFQIEVAGPPDSTERFTLVANGSWRRQAGDPRDTFDADVLAQQVTRVRLTVIDYSNPPLNLRSAELIAPVRQIVFARRPDLAGPLRLYYGNPKADAPHYDLERNLPSMLRPTPLRLTLNPQLENPTYEPEPAPLTERLPWLIYVVLAATSTAVAAILVDVGRRSIAKHDGVRATG